MQRVTEQLIHEKYSRMRDLSQHPNEGHSWHFPQWNFVHADLAFFTRELEQFQDRRESIV